jgi:hypothetical protein
MRRYIRHPSDIPIEIKQNESPDLATENLVNVSLGGLSFNSKIAYELGTRLTITISAVNPPYETNAKVCWCDKQEDSFEIGVELLNENDLYKARMVEQICHIAHYKKKVYVKEGRELTGEEAAKEWIGKFAHEFPRMDELEAI